MNIWENISLDHKINSPVVIDCCYQLVIWQNHLVRLKMFPFFKTQKGHHTVSENIQSNVLFESFNYKCGVMWMFLGNFLICLKYHGKVEQQTVFRK